MDAQLLTIINHAESYFWCLITLDLYHFDSTLVWKDVGDTDFECFRIFTFANLYY